MADGDESSLIDLNCSIKGNHISVPLLPLPKMNSPFEGDVSSDDNNPFDSAIQATTFLDDPFELVSKKVQEFVDIYKLAESGMVASEDPDGFSQEGDLASEREESEKFKMHANAMTDVDVLKSQETNGTTRSRFHDAHSLENCDIQGKRRSIESVDLLSHIKNSYICKRKPDKNHTESQYNKLEMGDEENLCQVNHSTNILAQSSNSKYSPESGSPKYSSTPIILNFKRKVREEGSPISKKRVSLDLDCISPASFVRDRVEKCIVETENKYRDNQETTGKFGKQTFRRSLDSQMPQYNNYISSYQCATNFTSKQNLKGRYSLQAIGKTDPRDDFYCSFKSLQTSTNGKDFETVPFRHFENVEYPKTSKCNRPKDEAYLHEAKVLSKLFEVAAKTSSETSISNESAILLIESDTDKESSEEENINEEIDKANFDAKVEKNTSTTPSLAGKEDTIKSFQKKPADPLKKLRSKTVDAEKSLKMLLSKVTPKVKLSATEVKTTGLTAPSLNRVSRAKSESGLGSRKDAANFGKSPVTPRPLNKSYAEPEEFVSKRTPIIGTSSVSKASKTLKKVGNFLYGPSCQRCNSRKSTHFTQLYVEHLFNLENASKGSG